MSTPPLPPMPSAPSMWEYDYDLDTFKPAYSEAQMQSYATAARADLEAENARLREALHHIEGVAMADEPRDLPGIAKTARAALERKEGMTKASRTISQEALKEVLHYDPDTGLFRYIKSITRKTPVGKIPTATTGNGYLAVYINGQQLRQHRLAWLYVYGEMPEQIDHINGIRTDNRIANLRPANTSLNNMNRKIQANNRSGFKGVAFKEKTRRYAAAISRGKVRRHLGYFDTPQEAHAAYAKAAKELHGEFAKLN